jgi:phosphohistidine phosphatase SixA
VTVDRLLTSPLRRARETAALLARHLGAPAPEPCAALDGSTAAEEILAELARLSDTRRVLLVGHMPVLGELLALAAGKKGGDVGLSTASVARVDFDHRLGVRAGRLVWLRTADQLAELAAKSEE